MSDDNEPMRWALEVQCKGCDRILYRQEGREAKPLYFAAIPHMTGHPAHEELARDGEAAASTYVLNWFRLTPERPHLPVEALVPSA